MSSAFSIDFLEPTSDFQTPITFLLVDKTQSVGIHFLNKISTLSPVVLALADMAHYATSS